MAYTQEKHGWASTNGYVQLTDEQKQKAKEFEDQETEYLDLKDQTFAEFVYVVPLNTK